MFPLKKKKSQKKTTTSVSRPRIIVTTTQFDTPVGGDRCRSEVYGPSVCGIWTGKLKRFILQAAYTHERFRGERVLLKRLGG